MKQKKIYPILMVIISIILCIPSIVYIFSKRTLSEFNGYFTYTLVKSGSKSIGLITTIVMAILFTCFLVLYFKIIKNEDKIFKTTKQLFLFITVISLIFTLILPFLSSDIYYYIGNAWLSYKYGENPYYVSVKELRDSGVDDEILSNTVEWASATTVYGTLWTGISKFFVSFSKGSVTRAIYIYKFGALFIHIANCFIFLKLARSKKYALLYGLNPLVLLDFLSNVHNEIYLIFFVLLALFFTVRKKNNVLATLCLVASISIKYVSALLVPFLLIYFFRDKNLIKRICWCAFSGICIILCFLLLCVPYFKDLSFFINMLNQNNIYTQSIPTVLGLITHSATFLEFYKNLTIVLFIWISVVLLLNILLKKKITLKNIIEPYNILLLLFIFIVRAEFHTWYIPCLMPTMCFVPQSMRRYIHLLTITPIFAILPFFIYESDVFFIGITCSTNILIFALIALVLINKPKQNDLKRE